MHAQSTALKDPIPGTFYRAVVGEPTAEGVKKASLSNVDKNLGSYSLQETRRQET